MPLINPPPNPTWDEIEAGMQAAADELSALETTTDAATAAIRAQEDILRAAKVDERKAQNNYRKWERAIRKKLVGAP